MSFVPPNRNRPRGQGGFKAPVLSQPNPRPTTQAANRSPSTTNEPSIRILNHVPYFLKDDYFDTTMNTSMVDVSVFDEVLPPSQNVVEGNRELASTDDWNVSALVENNIHMASTQLQMSEDKVSASTETSIGEDSHCGPSGGPIGESEALCLDSENFIDCSTSPSKEIQTQVGKSENTDKSSHLVSKTSPKDEIDPNPISKIETEIACALLMLSSEPQDEGPDHLIPLHNGIDSPSSGMAEMPSANLGEMPSASKPEMPSANLGEMPSANLGEMPSANLGEMPSASMAKMPSTSKPTMPSANLGEMPSTSMAEMPSTSMAKMPSASMAEMPSTSKPKMPSTSKPKMPKVTRPIKAKAPPKNAKQSKVDDPPTVDLPLPKKVAKKGKPSASKPEMPSANLGEMPSANLGEMPSSNLGEMPSTSMAEMTSTNMVEMPSASMAEMHSANLGEMPSTSMAEMPSASKPKMPKVTRPIKAKAPPKNAKQSKVDDQPTVNLPLPKKVAKKGKPPVSMQESMAMGSAKEDLQKSKINGPKKPKGVTNPNPTKKRKKIQVDPHLENEMCPTSEGWMECNVPDCGEMHHLHNSFRSSLSKRQRIESSKSRLKLLQKLRENDGVWIECCIPSCGKWRYLHHLRDPTKVPDYWICQMNQDPKYNDCEAPQQDLERLEEMVICKFTSGSLVWARIKGFPWWPALVDDDPDTETFYWPDTQDPYLQPDWYHVVFFDHFKMSVSRAWVGVENLVAFDPNINLNDETQFRTPSEMKMKERLDKSFQIAKEVHSIDVVERRKNFGFAARFKGKWGKALNLEDDDSADSQEFIPIEKRKKTGPTSGRKETSTKRSKKTKNHFGGDGDGKKPSSGPWKRPKSQNPTRRQGKRQKTIPGLGNTQDSSFDSERRQEANQSSTSDTGMREDSNLGLGETQKPANDPEKSQDSTLGLGETKKPANDPEKSQDATLGLGETQKTGNDPKKSQDSTLGLGETQKTTSDPKKSQDSTLGLGGTQNFTLDLGSQGPTFHLWDGPEEGLNLSLEQGENPNSSFESKSQFQVED